MRSDGSSGLTSEGLNRTALDLFERSRRSYERTYPQYGRVPTQVAPDALTLDFEIETNARVKLTPELFLQRGGIDIDLSQRSSKRSGLVQDSDEDYSDASDHTVWPKVSDWFAPGVDGTGAFVAQKADGSKVLAKRVNGTYRQDMSGQIELESIMMRPKDVRTSSFTKDLQSFLDKLYIAKATNLMRWKTRGKIPKTGAWYDMPFKGSKGIKIFGAAHPTAPCAVCHVQWTAGLPLQDVSSLLRLTANKPLQGILQRADELSAQRPNGLRPEYHALISMAAWVVYQARNCRGCEHVKRCMAPWLVRTHFGDLAMYLKDKYGAKELQHLQADVGQIGQFSGSDRVLPDGIVDYLHLPEMAEMTGMVSARNPSLHAPHPETEQDMPTDAKGLMDLSKKMLLNYDVINKRMRERNCKLHGRTKTISTDFTVKEFLDGIVHGKDLMSDHDSPLSANAFSHMVWKSMGSWRMKPGSNRVYLECRSTQECLASTPAQGLPGAAELIKMVGQRMVKFEKTMKKSHRKANAEAKAKAASPQADAKEDGKAKAPKKAISHILAAARAEEKKKQAKFVKINAQGALHES